MYITYFLQSVVFLYSNIFSLFVTLIPFCFLQLLLSKESGSRDKWEVLSTGCLGTQTTSAEQTPKGAELSSFQSYVEFSCTIFQETKATGSATFQKLMFTCILL